MRVKDPEDPMGYNNAKTTVKGIRKAGTDLILRHETEADHRAVEELTREAFWNHHGPGCDEHYLMHLLRGAECFVKDLDFVAELDGRVVGNIVYTRGKILLDAGSEREVLSFGPLSVLPEYQGRGIGGALVRHTMELAGALGHGAVLIYGDPDYYSRFGFVPAERYGIGTSSDAYADALQAVELRSGFLAAARGRFFEDPVYGVNPEDARRYDQGFPPKELAEGLPSQARFQEVVRRCRPR